MRKLSRYYIPILCIIIYSCTEVHDSIKFEVCTPIELKKGDKVKGPLVRGALVSTRFRSFEEFKQLVEIKYYKGSLLTRKRVELRYCTHGRLIRSILKSGVSETDFANARDGGIYSRLKVLVTNPYLVRNRKELQAIQTLSRRRPDLFGGGDPAFYDISKEIMSNIRKYEKTRLDSLDVHSEKGYFNTINHILSQAFMTTIYSSRLANEIANAHERKTMPALITGKFSKSQIEDIEFGAVDNYVDLINNAFGQELGEDLKKRFKINRKTLWTTNLLSSYLNEIQKYFSWAFQISFIPFKPGDDCIIKFANKINLVTS